MEENNKVLFSLYVFRHILLHRKCVPEMFFLLVTTRQLTCISHPKPYWTKGNSKHGTEYSHWKDLLLAQKYKRYSAPQLFIILENTTQTYTIRENSGEYETNIKNKNKWNPKKNGYGL